MAARLAPAERMRRHREELQLALSERLSLDQARERLRTYRDHLPRLAGAPARAMDAGRPLQWWQRD